MSQSLVINPAHVGGDRCVQGKGKENEKENEKYSDIDDLVDYDDLFIDDGDEDAGHVHQDLGDRRAKVCQVVEAARVKVDGAHTALMAALRSSSASSEGTGPWDLLRCVHAAWGPNEGCTERVQTLLQAVASALADVSSASVESIRKQAGDETAATAHKLRSRALSCLQLLYYLDHMVRVTGIVDRLVKHQQAAPSKDLQLVEVSDAEISAGLARFTCMEAEQDLTKYQQLVLYLLNQAHLRGYRRCAGDLFVRKLSPDGFDTQAWQRTSSIRDFVHEVTRKEINFAQWCNLTANITNASAVTEYLTSCRDMQLPDLRKDRRVFAFRNGIYITSEDAFVPHGPSPVRAKSDILRDDTVACKYFDQDLLIPDASDWYALPTPSLQGILDHQNFDESVSRWLYVFLGRLLYEVSELDGWQVIPFFKGQAGTGKSTLLMKVCAAFFEAEDVGVLSNNIERKFGLSAIVDKLIFVAPEIKGDLQMEQAEFQSVVSGEACQINIKYKKAETLSKWVVPGALAGNEAPNWVDNAGSVSRRMVIFDFCKRVDNADMELGKKLAAEIPLILLKCNRAYLDAVKKCASDSVWKHLPKYFLQTKQDLVESVNSLESFLSAGSVVVCKEAYMPMEDFVGLYHLHCDTRSLPRMKVNKDFKDRLINHSIFCDRKARMVYPRDGTGLLTGGVEWLLGVDVQRAFDEDDDLIAAVPGTPQRASTPDCGGDF
jgi:hypothetical protein